MKNENEKKKGEPAPKSREKVCGKKRVKEIIQDGVKGILISSERYPYYYFFSDEGEGTQDFKIKRLYKSY